ncbi:NAD(P)-binding protein [Eremomyces bilateralis CBS 781.70]|uniref:NAD(P)-binding protein n=1 Tax=Eremomyces bilateralis CBS 781.70 TaxID=1392243 RepID=A0A6G1FUA1_9PEZI|nr:NAD(P)-binding protein [Eremomyces bilateralis CBS 781.70]KAF1809286.1 NAD(P)-binding protein [Eremomyces bilateralis CBS 781.70]
MAEHHCGGSQDSPRPRTSPPSAVTLRLPPTTEPPSDSNPPKQKTWLIFGATGHMGRSLVRCCLSHGDRVSAVGWTKEHTLQQMQNAKPGERNYHGLLCDVRVRETVDAAVQAAIKHWKAFDIVVNCTGYGVIGACEDQDTHDLRNQFETNFLGTLNIIQLSLPYFRERAESLLAAVPEKSKSGSAQVAPFPCRYIIFSSTSGALGVPGLGPYCATKYAVEGLIESMLYEIDSFGIKASLIEPGHVRLDDHLADGPETQPLFNSPVASSVVPPETDTGLKNSKGLSPGKPRRWQAFLVKPPSAPYDSPTAPSAHAKRVVQWLNDRQPTSAVKSAELVWQLGHCSYPPLRLLLGGFAVESVRDRLRCVTEEIEDWKHLNFPIPEDESE